MDKIILFVVLIVFASCKKEKVDINNLPEKLEELKALKKVKRTEARTIDKMIERIDSLIGVKDPSSLEIEYHLVTVDTIMSGSFDKFLEVQSNVEADDELMVSSEIGGRITASYIKEGQYVKRGALVAKLDMESVVKQKAEMQKSLELAVQVFDKQKRLWDKKIGSEIQYLQAKNNKERLEKSLETIDFQLTKANVYAPMSGEVEMIFAESGETVGPGSPIAKILSTRNLKVVADVPEAMIRSIKKGDKVKVKIPNLDYEKNLRVTRIGSSVNPANRTFKVEVNVSNPKGELKPNLLAYMFINDLHEDDVISIPVNLIQQEVGGKEYVYTALKRDTSFVANKSYIKKGENFEGMVIITEGLRPGDIIVNGGAMNIPDNGYIKF